MTKIIIFDFDGTIADSSGLIRRIYNEMAAENGWPHMDESQYQHLRGQKATHLQRWIGVKSWQVPGYMREGLKRFRERSPEIKLFAGVPELIPELIASGYRLYVLSTNTSQAINEVLGRYDLAGAVTVLRRSALFGKHYAIRHLITKQKYASSDVWMVGDEVRDIEAAKRARVNAAAVTWGLQTAVLLKAAGADAIADTPQDLLAVLSA